MELLALLRGVLSAFIFAWLLMVAVAIWNAKSGSEHSVNPLGSENIPLGARSARQIRAEARLRREMAYKKRTLKRVKKAPGAHLRVTPKEADAIRKSGVIDGLRFDTHVHK